MEKIVKGLGRFCIYSGLFLFGFVETWFSLLLVGMGIALLIFHNDFTID